MRKVLGFMFLVLVGGYALAAGDTAATEAAPLIPGSLSMAIAAGLCALGMGKSISSACEGIARNPGAAGKIQINMIIGLALIESLAIYTLINVI